MSTMVTLQCNQCGRSFVRRLGVVNWRRDQLHREHVFCSSVCSASFRDGQVESTCAQCGVQFCRRRTDVRRNNRRHKSSRLFCSQSCAATYNNLHKTHGTRRSKLEVWLEERLRERYPGLEILFNAKETIDAELDIHFPNLNLAFELNGIYHYEPIHGEGKLASIRSNDHRKFAACAEKGISLCVIDVSTMNYFKPAKGQKFLDIITNLVDAKQRSLGGT